jgi:hypothetical protein
MILNNSKVDAGQTLLRLKQNFSICMNNMSRIEHLKYMSEFLTFLIESIQKQYQLSESLFKDHEMKELMRKLCDIDLIQTVKSKITYEPIALYVARNIQSKLVILLSEIVSKRICADLITFIVKEGALQNL